jgi:hypothetical protein
MRERRDLGEQFRRNVLTGDQEIDRVGTGRNDEILTFRDEQPKLVSPAPVSEPADATSYAATGGARLANPPASAVG